MTLSKNAVNKSIFFNAHLALLFLTLVGLSACVSLPAEATVYKWRDADGNVIYSQSPPARDSDARDVQLITQRRPPRRDGPPQPGDDSGDRPDPITPGVDVPVGIFSSSVDARALAQPYVTGALVRQRWEQLETSKGVYDFRSLDNQIDIIRQAGKQWSLAVNAGPYVPSWWGGQRVEFQWRNGLRNMPSPWDADYLNGLKSLANALADKYGDDDTLKLIYVPLISPNGIEGAWRNGTPSWNTLGYTPERHAQGVLDAVTIMADAFPDKAVAVELHEVNRSTEVPLKIVEGLDTDQVGIAMWWLGQGTYQTALQQIFKDFNGVKYSQIIASQAREPDPARGYRLRDYSNQPWGLDGTFQQAKELGITYIEPWPIDLKEFPDTFENWIF